MFTSLILSLSLVVQSVTAVSGWIPASDTSVKEAPLFLTVENPTMYDVYIVKAETDAATFIEFHEGDGFGGDEPVKEITVPAYGSVDFNPNGAHVVLVGLTRPLKAGDTVTVTLTTDGGEELQVEADVRER